MATPPSDTPAVSKVTFNPVSDSNGTQALIVTIKTVPPNPEDILKIMEAPRRSTSFDASKKIPSETKRKTRSRTVGNSKSTMTEPISIEVPSSFGSSGSGASGAATELSGSSGAGTSRTGAGSELSGSHGVAFGSSGAGASRSVAASELSGIVCGSPGIASSRDNVVFDSPGEVFSRSDRVHDSSGIAFDPSRDNSTPSKSVNKSPAFTDSPCIKHAAENITRKASDMQLEKMSLCNNCSKSMLSYIFVVQDFLESLAKEIVGQSDLNNCVQCLREETRRSFGGIEEDEIAPSSSSKKTSKSRSKDVRSSKEHSKKQESHTSIQTSHREIRMYEQTSDQLIERSISQHRKIHQQDQQWSNQGFQPSIKGKTADSTDGGRDCVSSQNDHSGHRETNQETNQSHEKGHQNQEEPYEHHSQPNQPHANEPTLDEQIPTRRPFNRHGINHRRDVESNVFGDANVDGVITALSNAEREIYEQARTNSGYEAMGEDGARDNSGLENSSRDNSGLENSSRDNSGCGNSSRDNSGRENNSSRDNSGWENSRRDNSGYARDNPGWENSLRDNSGRDGQSLVSSLPSPVTREAYVTMCRNNAEAMGCLVVGTSLLLSRTNRTLCVLMTDGVSNAFRGPLSCVFHSVVSSKSLDALGSTKLSLMEQPDLGVSFEKLNVWRLAQFDKCVYLNPDTLVLQNCDELFARDELSAVPDVGWPDCFNSGVFVFAPSQQKFWDLVNFAEKNGSYDGGDQGLLNSYFNSWSEDLSKKLSFVYNLMANVSYTYTPAFKQFGRHVKIVQFMGSSKPWHIKFFSKTGQISPDTPVQALYAQFVHVWVNIFRVAALRQLPQNIRSYAQSQDVISAVELLRFFPLPSESEADFFLTPPSVRMRLTERRLNASPTSSKALLDARRRKSAEFPRRSVVEGERLDAKTDAERGVGPDAKSDVTSDASINVTSSNIVVTSNVDVHSSDADTDAKTPVGRFDANANVDAEKNVESADVGADATPSVDADVALPGSAMGNYQGMRAWEQGRMDYQGTDASDTIIKRLQFLMSQPK